jgi:hypothetical protein
LPGAIGCQSRYHHEIYVCEFNGVAKWFVHAERVTGLVFVEGNPLQFIASNSWYEKLNPIAQLTVFQENIRARLIAEGNVTGNGFHTLFP